jgi:hypothetical protein
MNDPGLLATIPGEHIARAAMSLPDAASAPDEPHYAQATLDDGRRVVIRFRRFFYRRPKASRWFWTAESAELIWVTLSLALHEQAAGNDHTGLRLHYAGVCIRCGHWNGFAALVNDGEPP